MCTTGKNKIMNQRLIILSVLLSLSLLSIAQTEIPTDISFLSGDQKMVRMAVDSSLCILRQEYILVNQAGKEYGRDGKKYFGKRYSVGVIADNKIWTGQELLQPWNKDESYRLLNYTDSIKPRLSKVYLRKPACTENFTELTGKQATPGNNNTLTVYEYPGNENSVDLINDSKDTDGWLVLIGWETGITTGDEAPVNYTIYKAEPQFGNAGGKGYIRNMPVNEQQLVGGIYYTCTISLGKIIFSAAGVLQKDKQGWFIQRFSDRQEKVAQQTGNEEKANHYMKKGEGIPVDEKQIYYNKYNR